MFFVFYRYRLRDGTAAPWRARPDGFETEALADKFAAELLTYEASKAQQEYAATMVRFIEGLR